MYDDIFLILIAITLCLKHLGEWGFFVIFALSFNILSQNPLPRHLFGLGIKTYLHLIRATREGSSVSFF